MDYPSKVLAKAVDEISGLPGIGRKTALRLALHLLKQPNSRAVSLGNSLINLVNEIKYCKECHNLQQQRYYYKNPETQIQRVRKRDRNLDRSLTCEEIQYLFEIFNNQCAKCSISNEQHNINWGTNLHIDHILPVSKGGLTTVDNSQLLCVKCNTSKGSRVE